MAGIPKVKITFDADFDDLKKGIKGGTDEIEGFAGKMGDFAKKAGAAFALAAAAAGAYAVKLAVDGVKAAIEDEAAQVRLAGALKAATGATEAQIKATEDQILKMSLATGVGDDKLRPALQRIALSTGDLSKAQDLLSIAMDTAQATGKPLETVANAIGKAYDGNTAALGKLGIGLSAAELKTMSFTDVQTKLTDLFGGAAAANAETYAGRMERLKVTFDEAKETIGYKLLPIIQGLVDFVINKVVPALGKFADYFKPITDAIDNNKEAFMTLIGFIQQYVVPVIVTVVGGAFKVIGEIAGGIINVMGAVYGGLNSLIAGAVSGINALIRLYNSVPFLPNISQISAPSISVPNVSIPKTSTASPSIPTIKMPSVSSGSTSAGVSTAAAGAASVASVVSVAATGIGNYSENSGTTRSNPVINLTVNGAIDSEGTARTIINTLNDSYYRGTGGANALSGTSVRGN
jgi:hypothetical protein